MPESPRPPQERRRANEKETTKLSPTDKFGLFMNGSDENGQFFNCYRDRTQPNETLVYVIHANGKIGTYPVITDTIYKEYQDFNSGYTQEVLVNPQTPEGRAIIEKAQYLVDRDRFIEALRVRRAKELANGDPILEHILHLAFQTTQGHDPHPYVKNGIKLYEVNQNASHGFYLGTKDGRLYRYSSSGDLVIKDAVKNSLGLANDEPLPDQISADALERIVTDLTTQGIHQIQADVGYLYRYDTEIDGKNESNEEELSTTLSKNDPEALERFICTTPYEQFEEVLTVCKQRWGDTFRSQVTALLNRQINPTSKIPSLSYQFTNDPIDVTDEKEVYLGNGYYVKPGTMHEELETSLKIVSD